MYSTCTGLKSSGTSSGQASSLLKLRQLLEDKLQLLQETVSADGHAGVSSSNLVCEESNCVRDIRKHVEQSQELRGHLTELQRNTEQEISSISQQLGSVALESELLSCELADLERQHLEVQAALQRSQDSDTRATLLQQRCELQICIAGRAAQRERVCFREQALRSLQGILSADVHRYQQEAQKLHLLSHRAIRSMPGESQHQLDHMESSFDFNKQPESPSSMEDEAAPSVKPNQNPKYQLRVSGDALGNGTRDPGGLARENGPRAGSHLEGGSYHGSMESLPSWDIGPDRVPGFESPPPRVFNSPYTSSLDAFKPIHRVSEYKVQEGLSTVPSDYNIFGLNGHSTSPLMHRKMHSAPRTRYTATFDTLSRSRREREGITNHVPLRVGTRDKRDFIEELTKQLEDVQRRNQFLEAESIELDKERNQIRFEMRALLVAKEDLVCHNAKLQLDMKAMRERMVEVESNHNVMAERFRQMEGELKEAREVMIEANNQEYAFNFLQQSLKNKIQDAEEALEKQTLHAQALSEKLWQAERRLEELEVDTESRGKKNSELNSTVLRLEAELSDALQSSSQAGAELSLQQKLRADAQLRVEELEESLLEKDQEMFRLQEIISRLQGEVSGKLSDKEQSLEDEIQLRERIQLQCKQAERHVEDLQMELQTSKQAKEELAKQLKSIQERVIDLEVDLEDVHDSEQRWAAKHKKALEQTEQLQLKLIQEKDLSEQLECEKAILERQVKELRSEVDELLNSKVQEDVITRAESKVKELENTLRTEERSKNALTNTANKLERRINELTDQMEEEQKSFTEQKDLMTQRMRSLKRQLNEVEEEAARKDAQLRHTQRELAEERESSQRLQRQLLDQHLQLKRKESQIIKNTLKLDLSLDEEEDPTEAPSKVTN
ncbi:cingulin-like protein 1 isoform X3 [Alosa sapidissima]|uniref:cingulin-like protein 1 isoform X3 n=1 Tax=Alosa sapidissima TaxID=34773 RepID=UPI001C07FEBA|nr:cingulin-like protein 1 isoform X3 [Alosa sapidissima]